MDNQIFIAQVNLKWTEFSYKLVCSQLTTTHYVTTNKIIYVYFSHMVYLMNHVTSLNNTCGWSYNLSYSELQQTDYKQTMSYISLRIKFFQFFFVLPHKHCTLLSQSAHLLRSPFYCCLLLVAAPFFFFFLTLPGGTTNLLICINARERIES